MWTNQLSLVTDKCPNNECPRETKFSQSFTFETTNKFGKIKYSGGEVGGFYGKDFICVSYACTEYKM